MVFKLWTNCDSNEQKSNNRTPLRVQIGEAVPPDHAPPGITVVAHVDPDLDTCPPPDSPQPEPQRFQTLHRQTHHRPDHAADHPDHPNLRLRLGPRLRKVSVTRSHSQRPALRLQPGAKARVKAEPGTALTLPMVQVAGQGGPMMVHRPWTQKDMLDSLAHLPDPTVSGTRFSDELLIFCKEFSPTTHELRRLLMKKLGPAAYSKVRSACQGEARQVHPVWENEENAAYLNVLNNLMTTLKVAFPTKVDITKISDCRQQRDETVINYYTRLHLLFDEHSGMTEPTERGDTPTLWESHMIKWFLDGLLPHISAAIKKSCVGYEDARLTELIRHAKHAERQIAAEKTKESEERKKTGSRCPAPPGQNFRRKHGRE
ncbi:hypothetical protein L3Q82_015657 [Scortum barcoo]|uniref:Uncharacterized protein n=1 Tax=Scortum barcoo TaxID=214431 RepID=A0ACB8VNU1_9TELE|nr:hypothetical protein L3Q82_015657 [Scortum barcoo]